MQPYNVYLHPEDPESDLPEYATCIEARTAWLAASKAMAQLEEKHPDDIHLYAEPLTGEDHPGVPRPAMNKLDAEFMKTYCWDDGKKHFSPRPDTATPVNFDALAPDAKMAVLVRYGTPDINSTQLLDARLLLTSEQDTHEGHMVEALCRAKGIAAMHAEAVLELIGKMGNEFDAADNWPQMVKFCESWLKDRQAARQDKTGTVTQMRTASGATAGGGQPTDRSPNLNHDFRSLNLEIALGLVARSQDFDIYNLHSGTVNRAREIIKLKEKPFPAWNAAFSATPGILDYSRAMIIYAVKTAPDNIHMTPGALQAYINKTLVETDHANPDPQIIAVACGTQPSDNGAQSDETQQNQTRKEHVLADAAQSTGTVESNSEQQNGAAPGLAEQSPVTERSGPFYTRNEAGDVKRANKISGLADLIELGFYEISKEEFQALKNAPADSSFRENQDPSTDEIREKADSSTSAIQTGQQTSTTPAADVRALGNGIYDISALVATPEEAASDKGVKQEVIAVETAAPDFVSVGEVLEKELAAVPAKDEPDNLSIWRQVMRTNPRYTKALTGTGFDGTSINAEYMIMRATEIFGPIGNGWGYDIIEDRMLPGAPMSEAIYEANKFVGKRLLRDSDGSLITSLNHSLKIKLWYLIEGDIRGEVEAFGATPYMYSSNKSGIICDGEAQKKSLTDAIKKALSLLGFSADVWLGLYDMPEYKKELQLEFDIKDASETAEGSTRIREELDELFKKNVDTMRTAVTANEVSKIASSLTRSIGTHLKSAKDTADQEYAKYLEGRLRRLEQIKTECLNDLKEKSE